MWILLEILVSLVAIFLRLSEIRDGATRNWLVSLC